MLADLKSQATKSLLELIDQYEGNEVLQAKILNWVQDALPSHILEYETKSLVRAERSSLLALACDKFSREFLNDNRYYRCPGNGLFVLYDGVHCRDMEEDDIQHHVLSEISNYPDLTPRKHRTKSHAMRRIKERKLDLLVPEDETISAVLDTLHPMYFLTESGAKHFLVAVGESLLGRKSAIYICSPVLREIFAVFESAAIEVMGLTAPLSHFKKKYHGHEHGSLRFFHTDTLRQRAAVPKVIRNHILDYLIVAMHFAKSWGSADQYIEENICSQLVNHVHFTRHNNHTKIIRDFIDHSLVKCADADISESEAWFSFREYLSSKNLPVLIFNEEFHRLMREEVTFEGKYYKGYTSSSLPLIRSFSAFWTSQMEADPNASPMEIDDIVMLFRRHTGIKRLRNCNPSFFKSLIYHLYPDVAVQGNLVLEYTCKAWNKAADVMDVCKRLSETPETLNDVYGFYARSKVALRIKREEFLAILRKDRGDLISQTGLIDKKAWEASFSCGGAEFYDA